MQDPASFNVDAIKAKIQAAMKAHESQQPNWRRASVTVLASYLCQPFMNRFFDLTFKPFFVLTWIGTALGAVNAVAEVGSGEGRSDPVRLGLHHHSTLGNYARPDGRFHDRRRFSDRRAASLSSIFSALEKTFVRVPGSGKHKAVPMRGDSGSALRWTLRSFFSLSVISPRAFSRGPDCETYFRTK
jgi:hypothetical protein